jgi:hypothetical protein
MLLIVSLLLTWVRLNTCEYRCRTARISTESTFPCSSRWRNGLCQAHIWGHDQRRTFTLAGAYWSTRGSFEDRRIPSPTIVPPRQRTALRTCHVRVTAFSTRSSPIRLVAQAAMKRLGRSCTRHPQRSPASASSGAPFLCARRTTTRRVRLWRETDPA